MGPSWRYRALAVLVVAACSEPEVCTQSGCAVEPWIRVVDEGTAGGSLRPGDYHFRLQSAAVVLEWECTLATAEPPDAACDRASLTAMGELEGEPVRWDVDATHEGDGLALALAEVREDGGVVTGPDELTITVTRDGTVQAQAIHRPTYIGNWPNGTECGPYCAAASEAVVVRVPG